MHNYSRPMINVIGTVLKGFVGVFSRKYQKREFQLKSLLEEDLKGYKSS